MKKNIIQSATEPDKNSLWLSPQGLKKFSKKGWELIGGSNTPSDPSSGGSNDYILPFTTDGNIDSKYFDEIKEAINSGKTIKHKNSNGSYRTIDYTIVKDEYIYCFIGNFDENTQIIDISKSGYAFEYNICAFNSSARQTININANLPPQDNKHNGFDGQEYGNLCGYNLNIFDVFTGNCKKEDDIYTIYFSKESINVHRIIAQCIVYTNSDNEINVVILNMQNSNADSLPGFVFGHGLTGDYGYEVTDYGDVNFVDVRDYLYEGVSAGHLPNTFLYPNEKISTLVNNKLVKFKIANGECIYKNNTLDQLLNEMSYNKFYVKEAIPTNILKVHDLYIYSGSRFSRQELYDCYYRFVNCEMVRFMQVSRVGINEYEYIPYVIYRCDDEFNYYAHKNAYIDLHFKFTADNNGGYNAERNLEIIEESKIIDTGDGTKYLSDDGSYNTINDILIIDYSDINETLPLNYPDITNKPLYITGLWDYTPDNGSLTKRFIPATYTYNGSGSFTINYKVDISGPYEKKQIVGMIYYNGADKIDHTYHTVCPSYTINLNVQDGTNTGTFDSNNIIIYREVLQTIDGGGQIVIKGTDTTNYVEAGTVATDHVVLRWSVPRIEEDGTSVTLSVYELKLTPEDYTTKVIHKTI